MRGRGRGWLLLAGLLFAAGMLLMALQDGARPPTVRVKVPRGMDEAARARRDRRLQPVDRPPAPASGAPDEPRPLRLRDPMLAALPSSVKKAAVVLEANAIRNSPVGELLVACLFRNGADDFKKKVGVDVLQDVDRITYVDDTIMASGSFGEARWQEIFAHTQPERLGANTLVWGAPDERSFAVWKDQMVIQAGTREGLLEVIHRLDGTDSSSDAKPVLSNDESYGEIYGMVKPALLADALGATSSELAERIRTVASDVRLHVDASNDVGIVADVSGTEEAGTRDLAKALGAALVLARIKAATAGEKDLAEALDFARVGQTNGARFQLEVALPLEFFKRLLGDCAKQTGTTPSPPG